MDGHWIEMENGRKMRWEETPPSHLKRTDEETEKDREVTEQAWEEWKRKHVRQASMPRPLCPAEMTYDQLVGSVRDILAEVLAAAIANLYTYSCTHNDRL